MLNESFDLNLLPVLNRPVFQMHPARESALGAFDPRLFRLAEDVDFRIDGFLQSFKYFRVHQQTLRQQFMMFRPPVSECCRAKLRSVVERTAAFGCTLIGVHVRRSDFTDKLQRERGFVAADAAYIHRAIAYFRDRCFILVQFEIITNQKSINLSEIDLSDNHCVVLAG